MEERIAIIGLFVSDLNAASRVNDILHKHSGMVIGRMGIPCKEQGLSVISVIVSGTADDISALSGSLGRLDGVTVKSMQTSY